LKVNKSNDERPGEPASTQVAMPPSRNAAIARPSRVRIDILRRLGMVE